MSQMGKRWLLFVALAAGVIALDQVTKQAVIDNLALGESYQPVAALAAYFQITHHYNTGLAFGFFSQAGDVLRVLAILIVIGLMFFYPRIAEPAHLTRVAVALICGGALGNVIDRIRHDHVVDFIHYQIPGLISNISNLADHAIVLGVILILYDSWRLERIEKRQKAARSQHSSMGDIPPGQELYPESESRRERDMPYNE
jgi:signal peptidase II